MTEKIREYKMNGSLIIGVDAGYGNFKTARRVFPTAVSVSDKAPVFARDFIEWNGRYYIIGEGHKGFVTDKVTDDDNYVLTMAAVVKELEARGYTDRRNAVRIHLAGRTSAEMGAGTERYLPGLYDERENCKSRLQGQNL